MNKFLEYYSHQKLYDSQVVESPISHHLSTRRHINEMSTPKEMADFINRKLIDVIEKDLLSKGREVAKNSDLSGSADISLPTPMEKLTAGYEDFIKGKELNQEGKRDFDKSLKKASKPKGRGKG